MSVCTSCLRLYLDVHKASLKLCFFNWLLLLPIPPSERACEGLPFGVILCVGLLRTLISKSKTGMHRFEPLTSLSSVPHLNHCNIGNSTSLYSSNTVPPYWSLYRIYHLHTNLIYNNSSRNLLVKCVIYVIARIIAALPINENVGARDEKYNSQSQGLFKNLPLCPNNATVATAQTMSLECSG